MDASEASAQLEYSAPWSRIDSEERVAELNARLRSKDQFPQAEAEHDWRATMNHLEPRCREQALSLEIAVLRSALLADAENVVYLMIAVSSHSAVDNDAGEGDPGRSEVSSAPPKAEPLAADPEASAWPAFGELAVRLKVPRGVSYGFHRLLTQADGIWNPPDLCADTQCMGLARIVLPATLTPPVGESLRVAGVRLHGVPLNEHSMHVAGATLVLPVVGSDDYAAIAEDKLVRELLDEAAGHMDEWWQMTNSAQA